jgi:hypothetical protein
LDYFEASLLEMREALQKTLQEIQEARADDCAILDRLQEHLMGPLDVKDYGIHTSSFSRGRGSPGARGSPSTRGIPGTRGSPNASGTLV